MSRTYRRRKMPQILVWQLTAWTFEHGFSQRYTLDPKSPEGMRVLARYHSDCGWGDYSHACPPRGYRRMLNRQFDHREEKELHRWRKNPDYEVLKPRRIRNAGWYW